MEKHFEESSGHCVSIDTKTCKIFCHQCEVECLDNFDEKSGSAKKRILDFRNLFFPKIKPTNELSPVNHTLFENCNFPNGFLKASILLLFSDKFLRKTLKRIFLSAYFIKKSFGKEIFSKFCYRLGKIMHMLRSDQKQPCPKLFEEFYKLLIKENNSLSSYDFCDLPVK